MVFPPLVVTDSTGRFAEPTIFSAILNASAEIVKDELTPKDVGTIAPIHYIKIWVGISKVAPSPLYTLPKLSTTP